MRQTQLILLFILLPLRSICQEVSFYIQITERERILSYTNGLPVFDNPAINSIFSKYQVARFAKAFPLSGYEYLRNFYIVTADSIGLAQELVTFESALFPTFAEIGKPSLLGSYYPNDWNQNWPNDTLALAFINAPVAWSICKGDSNTIIGLKEI